MKFLLCCLLIIGAGVSANEREKRQAGYAFPGPRSERAGGGGAYDRQAASYSPQQSPTSYVDEQDDSELYQVPRRQFQAQPVQQQYAPVQARAAPAPAPAPAPAAYEPAPRAAAPAPRQSYAAPAASGRKKASASTNRANKYGGSAPQQSLNGGDDEDDEQLPDALTLLLQDSKFSCGSKNDGYYADDSVNCQVFHYCVGGARHSWMCPDGTVFHQVHLNCVPDSQDICAQSPKFHFVNDYLYKPVDYQGPNNTARYAQRYYPDGYVVGDPIVAPGQQARPQQQPAYNPPPPAQPYHPPAPAPAPVARPPPRQVAPPPPPPPASYNQPAPAPASYSAPAAPSRASRPSRPSRPSYQQEAPQSYRGSPASHAPAAPPSQQASYQPAPQDNSYQSAPPSRRQPSSSQSQSYSHSRQQQPQQQQQQQQQQQYRPSSNRGSSQQYQNYGSNQAAGVQYDEDY